MRYSNLCPFLLLCKITIIQMCSGKRFRCLWRVTVLGESCIFDCWKRAKQIQPNTAPLPPSYWHTCTHPHKHTPHSGRRGGLTNHAFISCQSGFIGFKWSLITTMLQSSTTAFSSMGSLSLCVGLFPKSSLLPKVLLLLLLSTFTTFHSNDVPFFLF